MNKVYSMDYIPKAPLGIRPKIGIRGENIDNIDPEASFCHEVILMKGELERRYWIYVLLFSGCPVVQARNL